MPYYLKWNKAHTKIKVWSTIVDGWMTPFVKPEEMIKRYPEYKDKVMRDAFCKCPYCERPMEPRIRSEYELAVLNES